MGIEDGAAEISRKRRRELRNVGRQADIVFWYVQINSNYMLRNPAFFRKTGHLSDAGIEAIYKLFDEVCSIEEAAKRMGISFRGAASRRQTWAKHRTS